MELSPDDVDRYVDAYRESEPLYPVERDSIGTLPVAFRTGEYGRRDAEWVDRWYFRRHLGAYPDAERRALEERFANAEFEAVRSAISAAVDADDFAAGLAALTTLPGVDVGVGSAFLQFIDPDRYVVVGEHEWEVVRGLTALDGSYPASPSVEEYGRYLGAVRTLRDRLDRDLWHIYMAIRRIGRGDSRE